MSTGNHWAFLGLTPTKDKAEIKAAYLSQLPNHHPEDDPEGFRRLREAFERATEEADRQEDPVSLESLTGG